MGGTTESKVYWNSKEHGMAGFVRDFNIDFDAMEPTLSEPVLSLSAKEIWEIRAFQGKKIPNKDVGEVDAIRKFVGFNKQEWERLPAKQMSSNLDKLQPYVTEAHHRFPNVSVELINAVIAHESKGQWNAISKTGALGVMQLTVDNYYKGANINPFDTRKSINYGVSMLSRYLKKFGSTQEGINKSLVAYNQGFGHVSGTIKQHGTEWVNHIHNDGRNYIEEIDRTLNNKYKIPGYFGEKK